MSIEIKSMVLGPVQTNCYLIRNPKTKETIIVDPGDQPERVVDAVLKYDMKPVAILLTHGHFDHIMAVPALKEKYGLNVYAHEEEADILEDPEYNLSGMYGGGLGLAADIYVRDGETLEIAGMTLKVLLTPGHTKGSVCYYIETEGVLFSGDTLFEESVGRSDFPTGSSTQLVESVKTKLFALPDSVKVFPGHGYNTTIGYEKLNNPFIY